MSKEYDKRYVYLKEALQAYAAICYDMDHICHDIKAPKEKKDQIRKEAQRALRDLIALSTLCGVRPQENLSENMNQLIDFWLITLHDDHDIRADFPARTSARKSEYHEKFIQQTMAESKEKQGL